MREDGKEMIDIMHRVGNAGREVLLVNLIRPRIMCILPGERDRL